MLRKCFRKRYLIFHSAWAFAFLTMLLGFIGQDTPPSITIPLIAMVMLPEVIVCFMFYCAESYHTHFTASHVEIRWFNRLTHSVSYDAIGTIIMLGALDHRYGKPLRIDDGRQEAFLSLRPQMDIAVHPLSPNYNAKFIRTESDQQLAGIVFSSNDLTDLLRRTSAVLLITESMFLLYNHELSEVAAQYADRIFICCRPVYESAVISLAEYSCMRRPVK